LFSSLEYTQLSLTLSPEAYKRVLKKAQRLQSELCHLLKLVCPPKHKRCRTPKGHDIAQAKAIWLARKLRAAGLHCLNRIDASDALGPLAGRHRVL